MKRLIAILFALTLAASAGVTYDVVGPGSAGQSNSGTVPVNVIWTHVTAASATNMVVGCALSAGTDTGITLAATYNAVAMTSQGVVHSGAGTAGFVQLFTLNSPATGSHSVSVTASGTAVAVDLMCGSSTFIGGDTVTGFRNFTTATGSGTTPSVTCNSATGDMVIDVLANGTAIPVSSQTQQWAKHITNSTRAGNSGQATAAGASSVAMGWTTSSDSWGMACIDVMSIPAVPTRKALSIQ